MRAIAHAGFLALAACTAAPRPVAPPEPVELPAPPPPPAEIRIAEPPAVATCGDGDDDCVVSAVSGFAKQMCACHAGDTRCVDAQVERVQAWTAERARRAADPPRPETLDRIAPILKEYADCATRALAERR